MGTWPIAVGKGKARQHGYKSSVVEQGFSPHGNQETESERRDEAYGGLTENGPPKEVALLGGVVFL